MNTFARSLSLFAVVSSAFALAGCEDNPDQFFKVAPNGAGQLWNDGHTAPYSDAARNSFNDNFNATSKDALCAGPVKHQVWSDMVNQPILPSSTHGMTMAGINLAGSDAWSGLAFSDAQKKLCQATAVGSDGTTITAQWGDAGEVQATYNISNNAITQVVLQQGYRGTLNFASRPTDINDKTKPNPFGQHKYQIGVGVPILRDGQNWSLDWTASDANGKPKINAEATELFDALMYTFAPELTSTQTDCKAAQSCLASVEDANTAVFGARPLGIYLHIPSVVAPAPGPSTPDYLYAFYVKLMPFSGASMFLKLDQEGPVATSTGLGDKPQKSTCVQKLGMKYSDFLGNCVNVLQDDTQNAATRQKLFGGLSHDKETYNFTVMGVDTDFASSLIGDDKIVGDSWVPDPNDTAFHFNMDVRATGTLLNEYASDGVTKNFGATGAIYREFARRVEADIEAQQLAFDPTYKHPTSGCVMSYKQDPKTFKPAQGCTGMEQFITPANPTTKTVTPDIRALSIGAAAAGYGFLSALKPGDPIAMFCADPTTNPDGAAAGAACSQDSDCRAMECDGADASKPGSGTCADPLATFYQHCGTNDTVGYTGAIFDGPYQRVLQILGQGDPLRVAPALRDRKYYFTHFGYAVSKYLMAASLFPENLNEDQFGPKGTACGGLSCEPNMDHLQFDQLVANSDLSQFRYTDRRWVNSGLDPISFEYQILIVSGNQQETRFRQHLDRDERAVFTTMATATGKPLLDEATNVRVTNLVGSNVLSGRWQGVSDTKDAYYCATNPGPKGQGDPDCLAASPANGPPMVNGVMELDDNGQPLLTEYRGAFTGTPFSLGTNNISLIQYEPDNEVAQVLVPSFKDPYNTGAGPGTGPGIKTLPDWRPLAPGAGFPIPVNGMRDRFVPSAAVDFSGQNLGLNIDYEQQADNTLKIQAAEVSAFEGEVFLCNDPVTNDLLHVRQYDSILDVQQWIDRHPGVQDACDMMIRMSATNASPVQLLAKSAGITATVGQGSGPGRIIDILMYDPSL